MRKIVLTFGLIAGAIVMAVMFITIPLQNNGMMDFVHTEVFGYTTMVIAMSMVFFGIKSYRDNKLNGAIKFGVAFQVGALIAGIASLMYVIGWEIDLHFFLTDFSGEYERAMIKKAQASGASAEQMKITMEQVANFRDIYGNVFKRMGLTLMEILPVGLLVAAISAAILRRKEMLPA